MSVSERIFKRSEIYWVNIEEEKEVKDFKTKSRGVESQKNRPGVIISNDKQNQFSNAVIVALLTSQFDKVYFFEVATEIEGQRGKVMTDQIYTIDKSRLGQQMGALTTKQLQQLEQGLHTILALNNCIN